MSTNIFWITALFTIGSIGHCLSYTQEEANQLQALVQKQAPTIVTLKVVAKSEFKMGGEAQSQEYRMTLQGVVVTPDGLIMLSSAPFSTEQLMEIMGGAGSETMGFEMKITPTSFRVIFEKEDKEYEAFLVATDAKLGLAFVKVEGLSERQCSAVDFSSTANPTIGQTVLTISRLSKGYDYAPYFATGRICGEITKPRKAWKVEGNISEMGLPVYTLSGEAIGVLTSVPSGVKEEMSGSSMDFGFFLRFLRGGLSTVSTFVVPAQAVKSLIEQASKRAAELAVERAKQKEQKKEEKPAPQKPAQEKPKPGKGGKSG